MAQPSGPLLGARLRLDVGAVAHGGFCVARHEGRVVFVRHTLPGERVVAVVTEDHGGSFCRADAVEIEVAAADRVAPPCPYAGPGRCGGCDWQHVRPEGQRRLKRAVVLEQFARLAGIDGAEQLGAVEELPGGSLGWRTRVTYAVDRAGRPGLHRHRSHQLEPVAACLLGVPGVGDADALRRTWRGLTAVEAIRGDDAALTVLAHRPGAGRQARGRRPPDQVTVVSGPDQVVHQLDGRTLRTTGNGFWQVHPAAASTFAAAVSAAVEARAGERVLDLYCGAGALTVGLADAVGPTGRVIGVEGGAGAVADGAENLRDQPWAEIRRGRVTAALLAELDFAPDLVVLDPPRSGAGPGVMAALLELAPRAVGYVACDPAALARDVRVALEQGWRMTGLRAFDAFPMTHHVECVARIEPA